MNNRKIKCFIYKNNKGWVYTKVIILYKDAWIGFPIKGKIYKQAGCIHNIDYAIKTWKEISIKTAIKLDKRVLKYAKQKH